MAEPFKSTPASRVFGMGLPRRSNLPPATFFDTPIYEERRNLTPTIRKNALAEQQMASEEAALAAKQADIERQMQGQEAMSRAFSGIEQGEEIENIFRKNPAIVYSPQFGQLYQASNLMEPSKASKTLVPNLAKSLPPEFRSEFLATASDPKYLNDPLGAYTAIEMKKNIADQRGRLRAMGVDVSKLKPDYYYSPEEESDFKSKLSLEAKMAEIEQKKSEERERDLQEARKWALKRGAQENMVNLLDSPSAIYQLGASIGGSRSGTASRDIIDRRGKIFNIAKEELEDAKRDFRDSTYDEPDVVEAKKKMLDEAQARYNQAKSDFEVALIEPPMEENAVMGIQLPDYAPYSPEFRAGFASAAGSPAFGVPLGGRSTVPAKGRVAGETATNITSPAAMGRGLPAPAPASQQVQAPAPSLDEELSRVPVTEQPKFLERKRAEQAEASKVNEEWSKAKKDLESKLKEQFPDKAYEGTNVKPLEQLAMQIVRGEMIRDDDPNAPTDEFGQTAQIPIHEAALRRVKLPRFDTAFTEPGKARKYLFGLFGTQDVTYNELIRDWAKGFLSQRGLIQTPVQENATVPREEVDKAVNFLNKKVAMPQ